MSQEIERKARPGHYRLIKLDQAGGLITFADYGDLGETKRSRGRMIGRDVAHDDPHKYFIYDEAGTLIE